MCCLLQICCPPLQRRRTITEYFVSKGASAEMAEALAEDLIVRFDSVFTGNLIAQVAEAARGHRHA